jgi:hypothetical protein
MIDEHVQESAVESSCAILAWSQGSPLRDAQRSTVATRWHCCAVLASANPIGRVCVCVKTQVECVVSISQKDSCVSAGDARGMAAPEPSETARDTEKRTMVSII